MTLRRDRENVFGNKTGAGMANTEAITSVAERRKSSRHNMHGYVDLVLDEGVTCELGSVLNISVDGCYVKSKAPRKVDEKLRLKISVGADLEITGMIVRVERDGFALKFLTDETKS